MRNKTYENTISFKERDVLFYGQVANIHVSKTIILFVVLSPVQ